MIVNEDAFDERNLLKAGYHGPGGTATNPLDDGSLDSYRLIKVPMTSLTKEATVPLGVKPRDAERSKNFFALGLVSWMYTRPPSRRSSGSSAGSPPTSWSLPPTGRRSSPGTTSARPPRRSATASRSPATLPHRRVHQRHRQHSAGVGHRRRRPARQAARDARLLPDHPGSDILHELSRHKHFGVRTVQAEDEIAAVGMALGAAFAGHLGVTTTSGPGMALKTETVALAVSFELPLLIVDIQRGGPSTGLPTKTEAADLNMAMFGRPSEAPLPVVAASSPLDCFAAAIEAIRIALKYRTPVILLSDDFLANGSEPWRLPDIDALPDISVPFATEKNHIDDEGAEEFWPYLRDPGRWPGRGRSPAHPGLMHRIGGIEKEDGSGNISYEPDNHQRMVELRAAKVAGVARDIPPTETSATPTKPTCAWSAGDPHGRRSTPRSSDGDARAASSPGCTCTTSTRSPTISATSSAAIREVLVPELNNGQLARILHAQYLVDAQSVTKVQGLPFTLGSRKHREERRSTTGVALDDLALTDRVMQPSAHYQEGLVERPGGALVPGLRRLRHPPSRPAADARARHRPGEHGVHLGDRLLQPLPVLHEHLRDALDPRPAPAIATGVAIARPDLDVWVITGDGDGLSIGGNHLIHALRRNVNLTILLFNNRIYGLTKGQYSPTSEIGKVTKSTPIGSIDPPFNPLAVALGAEASFVARTHDLDRKHMMETSAPPTTIAARRSWRSPRTATCSTTASSRTSPASRARRDDDQARPRRADPLRAERQRGVTMGADGQLRIVEVADVGLDAILVTSHTPTRAWRSPSPGSAATTTPLRRSASSAASSARSTPRRSAINSRPLPNAKDPATSPT